MEHRSFQDMKELAENNCPETSVTRARKVGPRKDSRQISVNLAAPDFKTIRRKRRRASTRVGEYLAKLGTEMGSKALNSSFGKRLINKGIDNIPNIFKFGVSNIKNKNLKRALDSEVANMVVGEGQKKELTSTILYFLKNGSNKQLQIEDAIKNIPDEDLIDNFVGMFPSNYINKFIDHAAMISDKGKYPFIIANTDSSDKARVHWWGILDIEPKTDTFFFDSFGLDGLNHFIEQDDKPVVEKIL